MLFTPEKYGIPSGALLWFVDGLEEYGLNMHGLLIMRGGDVVAEGYWAPFAKESSHRMYSVSKSITALAVGCLADEGRVRLSDPVAQYFQDLCPETLHPYLARATVRDLLMMATPHRQTTYVPTDDSFTRTFFQTPPSHPSGAVFSYNTAASVVLSALVERVSGQSMLAYMRPRLLAPMGVSEGIRCIETPEGVSFGGSGVVCTLRDLAKFARLFMNGGRWEGAQLVSEEYIRQATSTQIMTGRRDYPGYGYQVWCVPQGFLLNGMGSQMAYCFPEKDLIVAYVGDTQSVNAQAEAVLHTSVYEKLLPVILDEALAETPEITAMLNARLAGLAMKPVAGEIESETATRVNGRRFALNENPMGITAFSLSHEGDQGVFEYEKGGQTKRIGFGLGRLCEGLFPEKYHGARIGVLDREYRMLASAAWVEPHKLSLLVHVVDDYYGTLRATLSFLGDEVAVHMVKTGEWFLDDYQGFAGGRAEGR